LVHATPEQVQAILDLDRVHYVEIAFAGASDHDQSIPLISQDEVRGAYPGGGDVIAGIIDSGVDVRHGDLAISGWGWDVSDPKDPAPWTDVDGHGTHVAGTILGRGIGRADLKGNAAGLGYDATHRFLNVRLNRGTTWGSALDAFNYMATGGGNTPKAMVVNCSWHTSTSGSGTDAVSVDADARAFHDGILWVVAAGNRGKSGGSTINSPAAAKNVLAVANVQDVDGAYDVNGNWTRAARGRLTMAASSRTWPRPAGGSTRPGPARPRPTST
jgi:subtilisin family serine protease